MVISGGWMIGPAFISAPESASPQSSITPGNARPITPSAWSFSRSGSTPVGSRFARIVIATSNGPCLRVSHGRVPVSANAASARLPASCCAFAKMYEPNVPGGRNTTCPSVRCGASARAISACAVAGAGQRISSASRTASPMSVVISAGFASCRPRKSFTTIVPPAA